MPADRFDGSGSSYAARLANLDDAQIKALIARMTPADMAAFDDDFAAWAAFGQWPPPGMRWRTWLLMAGRGFGKTRAGAEWITSLAMRRGAPVRIALVGATEDEVRRVMVEGDAGLLAVARRRRIGTPRWDASKKELRWPGGSLATAYSGDSPDGLRGPSHHFAWCDELAKWRCAEAAWTNLQFGLRLGDRPRALVTTTPRAIPLLAQLRANPHTIETGGRSEQNVTLSLHHLARLRQSYGGTRLGRQELDGELLSDAEGGLWTRAMIEHARMTPGLAGDPVRLVIGVDPPASAEGDGCGIVVAALDAAGHAVVLEDASLGRAGPEAWARRVAEAAARHSADRIVAEANNGGDMVRAVLHQCDASLPVVLVHASKGKSARAEPVALLYEQGRVRHAAPMPELEDQMCGLLIGGGYAGPGRSPDRADALVWALSELMLRRGGEPRVLGV